MQLTFKINLIMDKKINFNDWMLKIKSIHYANDKEMALAFDKIEKYEKIQCT